MTQIYVEVIWPKPCETEVSVKLTSFPARIFLILSGFARFFSARSTLVRTKMVLLPPGSIEETRSVTLLLSASTDPSCMQRMMALGLDM